MSERLKKRTEQLRSLIVMLEETAALIRYRAERTDEIFRTLGAQNAFADFEFLKLLNEELERQLPFQEAWRGAAEKAPYFSDEDRGVLRLIGERLGMTDAEGQLSMLAVSREFAEKNLLEAEEAYRSKGALLKKTGLLCGAAAAILIL